MSTNGRHQAGDTRRRRVLIIVVVVIAILVFASGYLIGQTREGDAVASPTPAPVPTSASPQPSRSTPPRPSESEEPSPITTPGEPAGDLSDGTYFVQLTDVQGGEEGPLLLKYDVALFLTGEAANQAAADRGLETPVPNDYVIVNDNPKQRLTPLAGTYSVKYIPAGGSDPVKAHMAQFYEWMGETNQTDLPPKDTSWWWITIADGEVTNIRQQYLP